MRLITPKRRGVNSARGRYYLMILLVEVLQIVAPVFILASIGYGWVRLGLDYDIVFVTRLTMSLAVPCLIFSALVQTQVEPALLRDAALAGLVAYGAVGLAVFLFCRITGLSRRTFWHPLTFGNTGNIGLPLALFAFGNEGIGFAVIVFAVMAILSFTIGVYAVSGGGSLKSVVGEPMVAATVLGGLCLTLGYRPPVWILNSIDLVGQTGIPLMLITLGVAIYQLVPGSVGRAFFLSIGKFVLCFAIAYATGLAFGLPDVAVAVLVLQLITPVAVTSYMLAEKYKADSSEVAGLVVVSTLLSVIALPITLALFI